MLSQVDKDDLRPNRVLAALKRGGELVWCKRAGRYFIQSGRHLTGPSLSRGVVEKLEREGTLSRTGYGQYALSEGS